MYKLLMRAFPGWYRPNSIYALYPFTVPDASLELFKELGTSQNFDFSKPAFVAPPVPVTTWQGVVDVLADQERFHVPCEISRHKYFRVL
jgi:hypothetical protein